jgi:Flp pilus assembly protein TadG
MRSATQTHNHKKQKGQGLVEFALILPILLVITIGMLDLGRAFFVTIAIQNATREGARLAARNPGTSDAEVEAVVRAEATGSGLDLGSSLAVTTQRYLSGSDAVIRVTATYNFPLILGIIRSTPITITRFTEMLNPFPGS